MVLIYRASVGTTGRCVFTKFRGRCAVFSNRNHSSSDADCERLREPRLMWSHGKKLKSRLEFEPLLLCQLARML